jgi:hypothetical protein
VNPQKLARIANISKSALNSGLCGIGFRRDSELLGEALRQTPELGRDAGRKWAVFVRVCKTEVNEFECWDEEIERGNVGKEKRKLERTAEEEAIDEFFGDDPFCCVPDFLVEDAKEFLCANKKCVSKGESVGEASFEML